MIRTLLLFLLISCQVFANLTLWTPAGYDHTFILPENVTPSEFLEASNNHPQLSGYLQDLKTSGQDQVIHWKKLASDKKISLLIANERADHNKSLKRVRNFSKHLPQSFILPLGAAHGLSPEEKEKFYSQIVEKFKLLVPMGGDDVTPSTYNEKVTWAEGYDLFRDRLEIELIQYFYKNSDDGKVFGICRGMQLTCVAMGGKLHQDLIQDLQIKEDHNDGAFHEIYLTGPKNHPGTKFLSGFSQWKGLSWHHQALDKRSLKKTGLSVIAESIEGVVEAAASGDNRILLLQSHPEKSSKASVFFKALNTWVDQPTVQECRQSLKSSR